MPEPPAAMLEKILHALLLIQLDEIEEQNRFPILVRAGWSDSEIATALGISKNAVSIRRTRLRQKVQKESD